MYLCLKHNITIAQERRTNIQSVAERDNSIGSNVVSSASNEVSKLRINCNVAAEKTVVHRNRNSPTSRSYNKSQSRPTIRRQHSRPPITTHPRRHVYFFFSSSFAISSGSPAGSGSQNACPTTVNTSHMIEFTQTTTHELSTRGA